MIASAEETFIFDNAKATATNVSELTFVGDVVPGEFTVN